jgi:hypothetical protein
MRSVRHDRAEIQQVSLPVVRVEMPVAGQVTAGLPRQALGGDRRHRRCATGVGDRLGRAVARETVEA